MTNIDLMINTPVALNAGGESMADVAVANAGGPVQVAIPHPDTDYLLFTGSSFCTGLRQALVAGLKNRVKLVLGYPNDAGPDTSDIKSGRFISAVPGENESEVWRGVDGMARIAAGETLSDTTPAATFRLRRRTTRPRRSAIRRTSRLPT